MYVTCLFSDQRNFSAALSTLTKTPFSYYAAHQDLNEKHQLSCYPADQEGAQRLLTESTRHTQQFLRRFNWSAN